MSARYVGHQPDLYVIRSIFHDEDGPVGRMLDHDSLLVLNRARTLVGVRSGRLLASGRRNLGRNATGQYADVTFGVSGLTGYLEWHHDGTPPHEIRARRRKALRFVQNGQVRFARRVHHPGTRGTQFLVRALDVLD